MSHLLCLNGRTTIPTSAHTSVFIVLLNNVWRRQGADYGGGLPPTADAYYTDHHIHGNKKVSYTAIFLPSAEAG